MHPLLILLGVAVTIAVGETVAVILLVWYVVKTDERNRLDNLESGYYKDEEPDYEGTSAAVDREAEDLNRLLEKGRLPEPTPPPGPGKIVRGGA